MANVVGRRPPRDLADKARSRLEEATAADALSRLLDLPEGLSLGQGTQNRSIQLPGAELNELYRSEAQVIQYGYQIDISRKQFEPELYPQLLDLYERWVELSNMNWRIKRQ